VRAPGRERAARGAGVGRRARGAVRALRAGVLALTWALGCGSTGSDALPPAPTALRVGDRREVELKFLRFDVSNFEQTLTREDVLALPKQVQERLWLLDLDLSNGPNAPRLLDNALAAIKKLDPAGLTPASRNLQRLLKMTPDTADLQGTSLEQLIALAPLLGIAPREVLAGMMGVNVEDTFLSPQVVSETILELVIATHPAAQKRPGPVTAAHPDGLYPVTPGFLPVTLADAASDFATLSAKFGPYDAGGVKHPGFISGETRARVLSEDFRMTVRANANALPYKGVDLTLGEVASVNSVPSQIRGLFDFDDPNWLRIEGLVEGTPRIESLTFRVVESPQFLPGGQSPLPGQVGNSPAWQLPPWQLERVLLEGGRRSFQDRDAFLSFTQPGKAEPLVTAEVKKGWQQINVQANIGAPPAPSYLWDILLEVAQVRLHDGGIPEGEGAVEFTLKDIPVGTDTDAIQQTIRDNLQADPSSLLDVATRLIDSSSGDADFYYYRVSPGGPPAQQGDWLFFISEADLPKDEEGTIVRPYGYEKPGFYADEGLTEKLSSKDDIEGDTEHEKVKIKEGDRLFVEGKQGRVFRVDVGGPRGANGRLFSLVRIR
jgi:hypothetical protein